MFNPLSTDLLCEIICISQLILRFNIITVLIFFVKFIHLRVHSIKLILKKCTNWAHNWCNATTILETAGINNNGGGGYNIIVVQYFGGGGYNIVVVQYFGGGGYNIVVIQYLEENPTGILKYVRVKTSCTER